MKLTAQSFIKTDIETMWRYTQTPDMHVRWDLRFTDIDMLSDGSDGKPKRFRYATRIGFGLCIEGWGETVGDGKTSALRFGSDDPKSLIVEGSGSWLYRPIDGGIHFSTIYDYTTRYGLPGKVFDSLVFRPMMIWATRWSFDRLRLWIEQGISPEKSFAVWLVEVLARAGLTILWITHTLGIFLAFWTINIPALLLASTLIKVFLMTLLALLEVALILWLVNGYRMRLQAFASLALASNLFAVSLPKMITNPFSLNLSTYLGLLACSMIVFFLCQRCPSAAQPEVPESRAPQE